MGNQIYYGGDKERTERKDLQSKEGKAEVATCQWHVFSNDRSEAETGKEFRNGFDADLFLLVQKCTLGKCTHGKLKCTHAGARVVFDPIKNYVLTTIHGQDLPHFAGFCHLAHFSVK